MNEIPLLPPMFKLAADRLHSMSESLYQIISHPDADIKQLAQWIDADPLLLGQTLKVANSSFYGYAGRVETSTDAALILGQASISSICSLSLIRSLSESAAPLDFDTHSFLEESVLVACLAKEAAAPCGYSPEPAFSSGLLHAIGKMLALEAGGYHGESMETLGAALTSSWGFPLSIVKAILFSSAPREHAPLSFAVSFGRTAADSEFRKKTERKSHPFHSNDSFDAAFERATLLSSELLSHINLPQAKNNHTNS